MTRQALPALVKRAINETAHFLAQQQYGRLRHELLADALELLNSDAPLDEIVRAVRSKASAAEHPGASGRLMSLDRETFRKGTSL